MTPELDFGLLIGAAVLLVSVGAVRCSTRLGLPSLLLYLVLGIAIGEAGFGIRFDDVELTRNLGICALVVIIAEGGLTARWSFVRPALGPAVVLSTVGVLSSIVTVGFVAHFVLGLDWRLALLYGAVLSPTDAAAVFSTLRRVRLKPRLLATLEAESGINDAPVVLVVVLLSTSGAWAGGPRGVLLEVLLVCYELIAGAVVGLMVGAVAAWMLRRVVLPAAGLYPLAGIGSTVLAYSLGATAHASGILAVYVCGVVLGNARLPHRRAMLGFADGLAWLAQIGLFVMLGLLVSPSRLAAAIVPAIVVGLVLVVLARPLSVALSVTSFGFGWRDQAFLSWAGLRGAVPVVLATIPLSQRVHGAQRLFDVVFVIVVMYTALQGATLPPAATLLRVTAPSEPEELSVETAPLERMRADLLQLEINPGSRLAGVHLDELRLPVGAVVTLILREGVGFVPESQTRLKRGDSLLIVATAESRDAAEKRLRAVSRAGRLARWLSDFGE